MVRLRLLRILLPLLLLGVGWLLYLGWMPRTTVHSRTVRQDAGPADSQASTIWFVEYDGKERSVAGDVEQVRTGDDGRLYLEGIRDLEIHRQDRAPLIVNAGRGDREGPAGKRVWNFAERVVFRENDHGLRLTLPQLANDEAAGEARSSGDIQLEAPNMSGHAAALVYGLSGQPGKLLAPVLTDPHAGRVSAREATLWDGVRDIELIGEVALLQEGERLDAGRLRLWRGDDDRLERVLATERVWGSWPLGSGPPGHVRAEELDVLLDEQGRARRLWLSGDALLRRASQSLAAATIEIERDGPAGGPWRVAATNDVVGQALLAAAPGLLRAESLDATIDSSLTLQSAAAQGRVSFVGGDLRAEAGRATFAAAGENGQIELFAEEHGKARLLNGHMRVAAQTIVTDVQGRRLVAHERVEASLLPAAASTTPDRTIHLFSPGDAVHFVAQQMESDDLGARLHFSGSVRGWQGERNLAAQDVIVDQQTRAIEADGEVATRFPRLAQQAAISENEYVQISGERLRYDESRGLAVYSGGVRVRLAEGWLEARRVEVQLAGESGEIHEVRAYESVRLEFDRSGSGTLDAPVSGEADRAVYDPAGMRVLLYGDDAPAAVERRGQGGGTTTGRVLAYRLDLGTLHVDSGGQGPASIRTAER